MLSQRRQHRYIVTAVTLLLAVGGLASASIAAAPEPLSGGRLTAQASAVRLQGLIDAVPLRDTGRVSVHSTDNLGRQLGALDPIVDPAGGYLGVYHSPYRAPWGQSFRISLAHSDDLVHWTRVRVLDGAGASMPTLEPVPATGAFLLAYEKAVAGGNVVRVAYYRSRPDLIAGRAGIEQNLPRRLSAYNNGTPTILSIDWEDSAGPSLIRLGFHYQTAARWGPGADREAVGVLTGFKQWTAHRDGQADGALSAQGLSGNHGDWRQFTFNDFRWRIYEGQQRFDDFATWHALLYDPSSRQLYPLSLQLGSSRITSVGNPIVRELPAPGGQGKVLVVTAFVFDASARGLTGELVYYQPE